MTFHLEFIIRMSDSAIKSLLCRYHISEIKGENASESYNVHTFQRILRAANRDSVSSLTITFRISSSLLIIFGSTALITPAVQEVILKLIIFNGP